MINGLYLCTDKPLSCGKICFAAIIKNKELWQHYLLSSYRLEDMPLDNE